MDPLLLETASHLIADADAILIVAAAGMSVKPGEAVYVNAADFARFYPAFAARNPSRTTAYECMDLASDPSVSWGEKWGFWSQHFHHQRWGFEPAASYAHLKQLISRGRTTDPDYFVLSSNVDGCFMRSGFDPERIYTPQGDWSIYQCLRRCRNDAFWPTLPELDRLRPLVDPTTGCVPESQVPLCLFCHGPTFGNVRGGDWFIHAPYMSQSEKFVAWCQDKLDRQRRVVIIEVGCGFNTPVVTRFPAESFAAELARSEGRSAQSSFIRINFTASDASISPTVCPRVVSLNCGWEVLKSIAEVPPPDSADVAKINRLVDYSSAANQQARSRAPSRPSGERYEWRELLRSLARA